MKELATIQGKLKAPKGQYNQFGKYRYRSAEDILEAVKPLLAEEGCTLTITDDIVMVGGWIYVKATTLLKNADGETESTTAFARETATKSGMDASQITGSASSYARKYALNGLFAIDDTKDADATNTHDEKQTGKGKKQAAQPQAQPQQQMTPEELATALADTIAKAYAAQSVDELTAIYKAAPFKSDALIKACAERKAELLNSQQAQPQPQPQTAQA